MAVDDLLYYRDSQLQKSFSKDSGSLDVTRLLAGKSDFLRQLKILEQKKPRKIILNNCYRGFDDDAIDFFRNKGFEVYVVVDGNLEKLTPKNNEYVKIDEPFEPEFLQDLALNAGFTKDEYVVVDEFLLSRILEKELMFSYEEISQMQEEKLHKLIAAAKNKSLISNYNIDALEGRFPGFLQKNKGKLWLQCISYLRLSSSIRSLDCLGYFQNLRKLDLSFDDNIVYLAHLQNFDLIEELGLSNA